ncbi:imidazolonepropionase [Sphingorhabdus sp. Alg239-R122]|uniref:imidazolonepropionase n=1 Tax=Sphingorhabdus sp. Alg239-R122 TaxID=2305989 RepID=UPI001F0812B8|nr:imidazolonepropionase [Sphingorhabdus sp. Alg239-R122]
MPRTYILSDIKIAPFISKGSDEYVGDGIIAVDGETIGFIGDADDLPQQYRESEVRALGGRLVTPGLIDCHTHLVYGGSRAREFEMRLTGASYEDIMTAGGGIFSTVEATRRASESGLLASALQRVDNLIREGVTTIEVKSGYGLDTETELKMLRVARRLGEERHIRVRTTFLGAHAYPKDMGADDYLEQICLPTMEEVAAEGLVDAVDGFCETVGFTPAQIERVFNAAEKLGLPVKLHAEQLSDQGGAALAASHNALSADHLEYLSDAGIAAMADAGTVAVLLPAAFYALRETKLPPIQKLRDAGVPMALATDSNPGTSPMTSLLLTMNMGATLFGMTPQECLEGVTVHAARALGLNDCGQIKAGKHADLAIWNFSDPAEMSYRIGDAPLHMRIFGGETC